MAACSVWDDAMACWFLDLRDYLTILLAVSKRPSKSAEEDREGIHVVLRSER